MEGRAMKKFFPWTALALVSFACSESTRLPDAGIEDARVTIEDAANEATAEGGVDAASDGGMDAGIDAASEGGVDASIDAASEGGVDGGTDAATDAGTSHPGLPVGAPCSSASQCESPTSPECLEASRPFDFAGVPPEIAEIGLTFPNGYCSTTPQCSQSVQCGAKGACYRPFRDVTSETWRDLEPTLGVATGTLDVLTTYGLCLRACQSGTQCESGQVCAIPMADVVGLIPGAVNDTAYCLDHADGPNP